MLEPLLQVRGVRQAALLNAAGAVLEAVGDDPDASVAQAGRAVAGSLISMLGGELQDLLIDLDGGPVLLTPHGDRTLMTTFDDVASLGRVRFAIKRLLPDLK
ncbi:roadblock/LC7 domain-containing protein [Deinococcus sonorensis]|uniref:Roadblock/LC7 domain-containing protein n=2 Tax=Deinococcus sonorensis TaxID=309891 RepID=A0AAU7UAQ7_9DEIO